MLQPLTQERDDAECPTALEHALQCGVAAGASLLIELLALAFDVLKRAGEDPRSLVLGFDVDVEFFVYVSHSSS